MKHQLRVVNEDYNLIELKLGKYLKDNKISIYALARATNIDWAIVKKYATDNNILRIDRVLLSKIIFSLDCSINDIISFNKNKTNPNDYKLKIDS